MSATEQPGYSLAHPVYLDVPMMISFLAHLEGGVSTSEEETRTESGARDRTLKGRAGFRFKFPLIVDGEAGSDVATARHDANSLESKTQRHHTSASLFNALYDYLREDEQLVVLHRPADLDVLSSGQLVEIAGEYLGNPLEETLAFMGSLLPYLMEQQEAEKVAAEQASVAVAKAQRSGNPAKRTAAQQQSQSDAASILKAVAQQSEDAQSAFGMRMMLRMVADIDQVPVHDLVVRSTEGLQAVLTVSSEFYSGNTNQYLKEGDFRVVGKVTRVLTGDRTINLTRRTVLGAAGPEVARGIINSMTTGDLRLDVGEPIVSAPAVQILPMAIFI